MNDIYVTLTGNVAAEPRQHTFDDGVKVTSLRVLHTHRYFDRKAGQWTDGDTVAFAVRCWRELADNVAQSIRVGHPVMVAGKLRIREFEGEDGRRFMPEVEATSVGHNLRWGMGAFSKPERGAANRERRELLDEDTRDWAMGTDDAPARDLSTIVRELPIPATGRAASGTGQAGGQAGLGLGVQSSGGQDRSGESGDPAGAVRELSATDHDASTHGRVASDDGRDAIGRARAGSAAEGEVSGRGRSLSEGRESRRRKPLPQDGSSAGRSGEVEESTGRAVKEDRVAA